MAKLVLTAIGDDRAGLVSALAGPVADAGGNWLESQMARLAGKFAGIVLVEVPDEAVAVLTAAVAGLGAEGLLDVKVTPVADEGPTGGTALTLHLLGQDRPGIVHQVSHVLAAHGVTIDQLQTGTVEAPMAGGLLFEADALVRAPAGMDEAALQAALEGLANELMVDLDLDPTT